MCKKCIGLLRFFTINVNYFDSSKRDVLARASARRRRERLGFVGALDGAALRPLADPLTCVKRRVSCLAGENASRITIRCRHRCFAVFRRVAALVPRVRVDASVLRRLRCRQCQSRNQNQLHFEVLRARLMQQTFRRDFGVLKSIFSPVYRWSVPRRAQIANALRRRRRVWPLGLRTAFRDSYKPREQAQEAWTASLTFPSVRVKRCQATQLAPLVLCGLDDGAGTLVGVLKHILASHARA